jgi:hypothetical protein
MNCFPGGDRLGATALGATALGEIAWGAERYLPLARQLIAVMLASPSELSINKSQTPLQTRGQGQDFIGFPIAHVELMGDNAGTGTELLQQLRGQRRALRWGSKYNATTVAAETSLSYRLPWCSEIKCATPAAWAF